MLTQLHYYKQCYHTFTQLIEHLSTYSFIAQHKQQQTFNATHNVHYMLSTISFHFNKCSMYMFIVMCMMLLHCYHLIELFTFNKMLFQVINAITCDETSINLIFYLLLSPNVLCFCFCN